MMLKRRQPPPPCACGCARLAARLAEAEALNAAIIRTVVALRPIAPGHSIERGLAGWGVPEADARRLATAWRQQQHT
jgi:hypothetical protein